MPRQSRSTRLYLEALEIRTNPSSGATDLISVPPIVTPDLVTTNPNPSSTGEVTSSQDQSPSETESLSPPTDSTSDPSGFSGDSTDQSNPENTEAGSEPVVPTVVITSLKNDDTFGDGSPTTPTETGTGSSDTDAITITITNNPETQRTDTSSDPTDPSATSEPTDSSPILESTEPQPFEVETTGEIQALNDIPPTLDTPPPETRPLALSDAEVKRIIDGFLSSREYAQNQVQVNFLKYLNRLPEAKSLAHWTDALASKRLTEDQFIAYLVSSPESLRNHGFNVHSVFKDLYQNALGREADEGGLEAWTLAVFNQAGIKLGLSSHDIQSLYQSDKAEVANQALVTSQNFQVVLRQTIDSFLRSNELHRNSVQTAYGGILGRQATDPEIQQWVQYLAKGHSEQQLLEQFLASNEYRSQYHAPRSFVTGLYGDLLFRAPDAQGFLGWFGKVDQHGKFQAPLDPELADHFQQLVVTAQSQSVSTDELLQNELDEAFAYRLGNVKPESFQFIADKNLHFTLGITGSFIKSLLPPELTQGVDFSDSNQLYAFLSENGDEIGKSIEENPQIQTMPNLDLGSITQNLTPQAEELFQWVKSLYFQSLPERISKYLPAPDPTFDWAKLFSMGMGTTPINPDPQEQNTIVAGEPVSDTGSNSDTPSDPVKTDTVHSTEENQNTTSVT